MPTHSFAYLFERFPSYTQTFCSREVEEMARQGMAPWIVSIRSDPESKPSDFPASLQAQVHYLPPSAELEAEAKQLRAGHRLPRGIATVLGRWGDKGDKMRAYEAIHLGPLLKERGIRHVHAHFAGMAARTAFWLDRFFGVTFSLTGHANDIFCEQHFPVSLGQLVTVARLVITETEFSRDWLASRFPKHGGKIFRVYNGIDVGKFAADAEKAPYFNIISVGRYIEKKGFEFLIQACRILDEQGVEFHCEIFGEGPLRQSLEEQIGRSGLQGRVVLAGPRSQAELIPLLASASVFVLPCVREKEGGMDNLPTVIVEAMSAGLPVISTSVAGVPEMITDGETGWIVSERDAPATARAIACLAHDRKLALRFGAEARTRASQAFSISTTVRRLKHLLVGYGRVSPPVEAVAADPDLKKRRLARITGIGTLSRGWEKKI